MSSLITSTQFISVLIHCRRHKVNGSMPFLDTLVIPQPDGILAITVYRNLTHTDQYLQCDSHHTIQHNKVWLVHLNMRPKQDVLTQSSYNKKKIISKTGFGCKYPMWALNGIKIKNSVQSNLDNSKTNCTNQWFNTSTASNKKKTYIRVPYTKDLSESFKCVCGKHGIQVILQRRKHHQEPPGGSQGQRSH